jgi:hypothetical protein
MRKNATGIKEFKIVPIYKGNRLGRTMTAKAAAKRDPDRFLELYDAMCKQREHLRTEQLNFFDAET